MGLVPLDELSEQLSGPMRLVPLLAVEHSVVLIELFFDLFRGLAVTRVEARSGYDVIAGEGHPESVLSQVRSGDGNEALPRP